METFILSYTFSLGMFMSLFLSDILMRPFDTLPRIAFYLAFPLAIFINTIIILVGSYFGIFGFEKRLKKTIPHVPAESVG